MAAMLYFYYFLYIGWHWNFNLAWFVIRHEMAGERQYGIHTTGTYNLKDALSKDDRRHATWYEPVNYYSAGWLFGQLQPADISVHFLDVGCGKGRVLAIAAAHGFTKITGIDFSPRLCAAAMRLVDELQARHPALSAEVICMNVRDYAVPDTVGVIFLFNPFTDDMMAIFIAQVMASLHRRPRRLKVLYANPQCKEPWLDAGFTETAAFTKLEHLKGSVLVFEP
ncbi:class I SAM-dependent methyltransferase [Chitinophaga lutea]|uniref:Class I SAM-dependent methyltransferase n=2 Tax=Chitinophaga lutea TaxID=2488634 RepID=A0A3N4PBD7_9BACT|nr:class I SAM-dependent methyltransferase [Chitinophaga lutea]